MEPSSPAAPFARVCFKSALKTDAYLVPLNKLTAAQLAVLRGADGLTGGPWDEATNAVLEHVVENAVCHLPNDRVAVEVAVFPGALQTRN